LKVDSFLRKRLPIAWRLESDGPVCTPFWVIDNRPLSIMCSSDGTLTGANLGPCPTTAPATPTNTPLQIVTGVSPSITDPNGYVLAPNSGDYIVASLDDLIEARLFCGVLDDTLLFTKGD
jgi:hypothetical protein